MRKAHVAEQTKVHHRVADCLAAITIIIMSLFEYFSVEPIVHRAALQLQVACHPVLLIHKQNLV